MTKVICQIGCTCGRHKGKVYEHPWRNPPLSPDERRRVWSEAAKKARANDSDETKAIRSAKAKAQAQREAQQRSDRMKAYWAALDPEQRHRRQVRAVGAMRTKNQSPEAIAKRAASLSAYWQGQTAEARKALTAPAIAARSKVQMTSLEVEVAATLTLLGIPYRFQVEIAGLWADFVLDEPTLILEADGLYWHDPEADAMKDGVWRSAGFHVERLSEAAIKADVLKAVVGAILKGHARGI